MNLGGYDVPVRPFDPREVEHVISAACWYWAAIRFGAARLVSECGELNPGAHHSGVQV